MYPGQALDSGNVLCGRYELSEFVARDIVCDAWLASDQLLARPVLVKVVRAEYAADATAIGRFRETARAAAALEHENLVRIYDFDESGPARLPFLVLEFAAGSSVRQRLTAGPMSPAQVMDVVAQAAAGLAAAHAAGLRRLAIGPDTVLLSADGVVKISSDAYLAPELAATTRLMEPGSDLAALGMLARTCLDGWNSAEQDVPADVAALIGRLTDEPSLPPGDAAVVAAQAAALRDTLADRNAEFTVPAALPADVPDASRSGGGQATLSLPPGRARRRRKLPLALAAATAIAAAAAFTLASISSHGAGDPAVASARPLKVSVDARSLRGMPVGTARRLLLGRGLHVHVRWRHSPAEPPGRVLSVYPHGTVKRGTAVVITGSLAPGGPGRQQSHRPANRHRHHAGGPRRTGRPSPSASPSRSGTPGPRPSPTPSPSPTQPSPSASPSSSPSGSPPASGTPNPSRSAATAARR
jgi:eukaryotic-like serine/threonine-protein kinase